MQYDVKQGHLNQSGFLVLGRNRVKGISFVGTATAGQVTLFDTTTAPVTTATYGRSGTTVTVTQASHGLTTGQVIGIEFSAGTGGAATNGNYAVTVSSSSVFTLTDINTGTITASPSAVFTGGGRWLLTYDVMTATDTFSNAPLIPGEGVVAVNGIYAYMTNILRSADLLWLRRFRLWLLVGVRSYLYLKGRDLLLKAELSIMRLRGLTLKAPQPQGGARKRSFCARMSGMPGPMKDENGKPTRKAASLKRWKC